MESRNLRKMYFARQRKLLGLERTRNLNQSPKKCKDIIMLALLFWSSGLSLLLWIILFYLADKLLWHYAKFLLLFIIPIATYLLLFWNEFLEISYTEIDTHPLRKKVIAGHQAVISNCGHDPINRRIFWH